MCVARLAEFFPEAMPVRIPLRVTRKGASRTAVTEDTTIEFGTQQEVLFASGLSLDFEERIHLENSDGSLDIEAKVGCPIFRIFVEISTTRRNLSK